MLLLGKKHPTRLAASFQPVCTTNSSRRPLSQLLNSTYLQGSKFATSRPGENPIHHLFGCPTPGQALMLAEVRLVRPWCPEPGTAPDIRLNDRRGASHVVT